MGGVKRYWKSILGCIVVLAQAAPVIWRWLSDALDWGLRLDFVAIHHAGIVAMLTLLSDPPSWVAVLLTIIGFVLIYADVWAWKKRQRPNAAASNPATPSFLPHKTPKSPLADVGFDQSGARGSNALRRAIDDHNYEEVRAWMKETAHDAPIALIAHVSARIGDKAAKECFPAARRAIRQAALDGSIRLRGRKQIDRGTSKTEFSDVFTDIPAEYWNSSVLNALATGPLHEGDHHTDPESAYAWGPKGVHEKNRYAQILGSMKECQRLWGV